MNKRNANKMYQQILCILNHSNQCCSHNKNKIISVASIYFNLFYFSNHGWILLFHLVNGERFITINYYHCVNVEDWGVAAAGK